MPELPEVETVKNLLNTIVPGAEIADILIYKPNIIKTDLSDFKKTLIAATFTSVDRIGKFLIFHFNNNAVLVSHLRMEGKYLEQQQTDEDSRFARVVFLLKDGRKLTYDDSRMFGTMELTDQKNFRSLKSLNKLGKEPFVLKTHDFHDQLKNKRIAIKLALLDQTIISGLGNIYVDEVLYASKVHPLLPAKKVDFETAQLLLNNSIEVLNKAIKAGGTTVRSYVSGSGKTGHFQVELKAYGKAYTRCSTCDHLLKKIFVGGRGTSYCPHCQRIPGKPIFIGITGHIGAGKSTIGNYIKEIGLPFYDADKIVKELYKDPKVINKLSIALGIDLLTDGAFDRNILREHLQVNPKDIKIVNKVIHPLVKHKIIEIMENSVEPYVYFEIPLIFSQKIDELFDFIVGIEVAPARQIANLLKRGVPAIVTPDREYIKNRHKVDYIIINDGSIEELITKFKKFKV